jgi:hypothetical protein
VEASVGDELATRILGNRLPGIDIPRSPAAEACGQAP